MSRTNRFLKGVGWGYANQALIVLVGLWLTPFLLSHVGQRDLGLWLVGTQIVFYLGLLDLGIIALLPRATAGVTGRADYTQEGADLSLLVGQTVRLVLWQTPLVALAIVIAWFALPVEWEGLRQPVGLVLLAFLITFPLRIFSAVLQGLQDLEFLSRTWLISFFLSTALTIGLVFLHLGLNALAIGWAFQQLFNALACWHRLRSHFPHALPGSLPKLLWPNTKIRLKQGFWVSLNQIAQVLLSGTDILIVGKVFGPAAVVPYVCTGKLVSVLANQPQMLIALTVGSSRVDLQACKLEYSIVSPK